MIASGWNSLPTWQRFGKKSRVMTHRIRNISMKVLEADEPMSGDDVEAALRLLLDLASQATTSQILANATSRYEGGQLTKRKLKVSSK